MTSESRNTPSRRQGAICSEPAAVWIGLALSLVAVLVIIVPAVIYVWNDSRHLGSLLLALWPSLVVTQFWASRAYRKGLSGRELFYTVFFLADVVRIIWFGIRAVRGRSATKDVREHDDRGTKIIKERTAVIIGAILTMAAFVFLLIGLKSQLSLAWSAVCLGAVLWTLCSINYYWVSEAYKGGLNGEELALTLLGPVAIIRMSRSGVQEHIESQDGRKTS